MDIILTKLIGITFNLLFLTLPLILFPKTSEIFEFNKIVFVYGISIILTAIWIIRMLINKKLIFRQTRLNIPIIIFICSQILSTLFSLDQRTSLLGYYSRFNGGLTTTISYSMLYLIYVSNMDKLKTLTSIRMLFYSTLATSIWGIFEHFGHSFSCLIFPNFGSFDVNCWVQDVRNRVFSSFGQPNWLAAWLTAIIPLTWASMLNAKKENGKQSLASHTGKLLSLYNLSFSFLSFLFFITLLYTKSRSGILAFCIAFAIFWGGNLYTSWKSKNNFKKSLLTFLIPTSYILILTLIIGTPWTSKISELLVRSTNDISQPTPYQGPALESGGTESGSIRKIVWTGAIEVLKKYPVFGSGVETFAYSYYGSRPIEHNLTSEWDYLYNKAHNEYLNYAATTGIVGLGAYLLLIFSTIFLFTKIANSIRNMRKSIRESSHSVSDFREDKSESIEEDISLIITIGLLSGYVSILVTNFFGFSVVPISVLFFLLPAFAITLRIESNEIESGKAWPASSVSQNKVNTTQKFGISLILLITSYFLLQICRYWFNDYTYAKGKFQNDSGDYTNAIKTLTKLVKDSPNEPVYWDELADTVSSLAITESEKGTDLSEIRDLRMELANSAITDGNRAISLSPANVNFKRKQASRLINMSALDPNYLELAKNILLEVTKQAPTDARLFYNLGLSYLRTGDYDNAIATIEKTVELKPDYERARFALALMYQDINEKQKAKDQLMYILTKLNPNSEEAKRELDGIGK